MTSVLNLAGVVDSLGTGEIEIERATQAVTIADGNATVPTPRIITIAANVQHATSRDLLRLPENDRTREVILIFTKTALEVGSPTTGKQGDIVRYGSPERRYEVIRREDWLVQSGHYRCYAGKIEGDR
jgi:hypothetical protein